MKAAAWLAILLGWGLLSWLFLGVARLAAQADELWVIGSTLEVMPAASIVPVAAQAGVPITIMNMGRTQYDRLATRLIRDDIAIALPQLVDETIAAEQGK